MNGFLANIRPFGSTGLYMVEPLSPTDPGFGHPGGGVDPGYGQGTFPHPGHGLPGYGRPDNDLPWGGGRPDNTLPGYGHPGNRPPINIPPPEGVVTPPIVLPERPTLPPGSGVVVPVPEGVAVPSPTVPGTKPYILWYGPGTDSSVVYLAPPEVAAPK
jgi:hypothetical protein